MQGKILKLTSVGVLFQIPEVSDIKVNDQFRLGFVLPGGNKAFNERVTMIKAYSKYDVSRDQSRVKVQIFECHFLDLALNKKTVIDQFAALNP